MQLPQAPGTSRSGVGAWLAQTLLPYWVQAVDAPGDGFYEALDPEGQPLRDLPRTTLTHARLVYVWSHAHVLTGDARYLAAARKALAFLEAHCGDTRDGWRMGPHRAERDCYDHAFVLFGLAWLARTSADARCVELGHATWDYLQRAFGDPTYGGFFERAGQPDGARRQNPHMHLLEACLAWFESTGDTEWLARADALTTLLQQRFVDASTGSLIEHFQRDWTPAPGPAGTLREPGHHFEWVWLLDWRARLGPAQSAGALSTVALDLWHFGNTHGVERSVAPLGLAWDEVNADGSARTLSKLVWPQTELVKALVVRSAGADGAASLATALQVQQTLLAAFFDLSQTRWNNQLTRDGQPRVRIAPTRMLYHLMLSAAELDRALSRRT